MYKLQKFMCHYNIRKYSFCARVVNIWKNESIHMASPVHSQQKYIAPKYTFTGCTQGWPCV